MILTRSETAAFLKSRDNYCILTHVRPDGDTIGSAAVLCAALRQIGKTAHILHNPGITPMQEIYTVGMEVETPPENAVFVSVDVAAPDMLPENMQPCLGNIALRIDHHGRATSYTELELVDPGAAACGEIIWDVLQEMGAVLDKEMAIALYVAVSTDTGCFRYANTNAHTYLTAAACASTGADLYPTTQALFDTNTMGKLKIQSYVVENAMFAMDGQVALCAIPLEVEQTVAKDDMESVSGFLRSIEGVKMAALLREKTDGSGTKISVRAVPGYDASAVCEKFGGGGHKGAAGASLDVPLAEALEIVKAAVITAMEEA